MFSVLQFPITKMFRCWAILAPLFSVHVFHGIISKKKWKVHFNPRSQEPRTKWSRKLIFHIFVSHGYIKADNNPYFVHDIVIIKSWSTASARLLNTKTNTLDWWLFFALWCTQQGQAPNIDHCSPAVRALTNGRTDRRTDRQTDGRTLPIPLSPSFTKLCSR